MGNFAVATFKQGGMTNDNLGFMAFPEITPGIPRSEDAPTDTIHITAGAKNVDDAKLFLAFVASADAQTKLNAAIGQLPTNKNSTVPQDDPFLVHMPCRSSSTVTRPPKWPRPAWKASSSS
jgi:multiple sugar transport system substrate-binding protein